MTSHSENRVVEPSWAVGRIAISTPIIDVDQNCGTVLELLMAASNAPGAPVMQGGVLVGLASRERLLRIFANPLYQALYQKRSIRHLMNAKPFVVDAATDIDSVTYDIAEREREALQDGFLVTRDGVFFGVGSAHRLLELVAAKARSRVVEIDEARQQAERASKAKSNFLASMSHELRTPLNAIIGFSEMLQLEIAGPLNVRQREYLSDVHGSANDLLELINDVLDLSSIEANKIIFRDEPVELGALITECLRTLRPRTDAKQQSLRLEESDKLRLLLDHRRLKQIVLNLLTNAIKYTPRGGDIAIHMNRNDAGQPGFMVCDNGIGIAPEHLEQVLNPFGRVVNAYTRDVEGTGIGLALARSLCEHYGGTLVLDSTLGHGTCVSVRFPVERVVVDRSALLQSAM